MIDIQALLMPDEQHTGTYSIEVARWNGGRWTATVPPLYASLTNRRLILYPQTRRRYDPAVIPRRFIRHVSDLNDPFRRGVVLHLQGGTPLSLFAAGNQGETFIRQLYAFCEASPLIPACPVRFEPRVEGDHLRRLIHRIQSL